MLLKFNNNRFGNISVLFALLLVPLIGSLGIALDYQYAINEQTRLQSDLDAALLQAVRDVEIVDQATIVSNIKRQMKLRYSEAEAFTINDDQVIVDRTSGTISTIVSSSVPTAFLKIFRINQIRIAASSAVNSGKETVNQTALSMYLVLDQSGSMTELTSTSYSYACGYSKGKTVVRYCTDFYTKMESLKIASAALTAQIATADPTARYARLGAVSFNSAPLPASPLAFGTTAVASYVAALSPVGGTNSSTAMSLAYDALTAPEDAAAHKKMNGLVPDRFIVFMTDGDNNLLSADAATRAVCDKARAAGIRIYTIAFMAPTRGQQLLQYCATNPSDYFTVDTTAELVSAFKMIGRTTSKSGIRLTM